VTCRHGDDAERAPLLCAGLIGWRSYRMAGEGSALAPRAGVRTAIRCYPLAAANAAVADLGAGRLRPGRLRQGRLQGAAVLVPSVSAGRF
jgi:hypothetical protein